MQYYLDLINTNSAEIRLSLYLGLLVVFFIWESLAPRVEWTLSRVKRDLNNLALSVLNTIALRFLVPLSAVAAALHATEINFGLLNWVEGPQIVSILLTIVILDLAIYFQHIIFHKVPVLWRLHRVHHLDKDLDVTSGNRFHPIEMVLSMLIKIALVYSLGLHFTGVILFSIVLNASSLFNHSNIYLSEKFDKLLKLFIVTPDMHRIHHSEVQTETDSNFGFFFSFWDRIFKTYMHKNFDQQKQIKIGLKEFDANQSTNLLRLLVNPFK